MKQKILIADDEPDMQKMLARALDSEPYELVSTYNGKDAFDIARAKNPDIILLDINMPMRDGLDVLRGLRQNNQTRMIPVIMLTWNVAVEDEVAGLDMGADDYISKPFDIEELKARIASVLRRNQRAISANPLTRLPGSPMIEEEVNRRIRERSPFAFLYIDINHFKSYNDAYGFERGDRVIRETAEMLLGILDSGELGEGFIGHVGGDDFVAITDPIAAPHLAQRVVSRFDDTVPRFYNSSDRSSGFVRTKDRQGQWRENPLISLSIGIVSSERGTLDHYAKVVEIASEMKAYCKSNPINRLSRFAFDRRRGGL